MSLLEDPSLVRSAALRSDDLEDAFRARAHDPAGSDVLDLGPQGDVTIATAVAAPRHATVDPDGPRCRSLSTASHDPGGLACFDAELSHVSCDLVPRVTHSKGHRDVR